MAGGKLGTDFLSTVHRTVASIAIAAVIAIPFGIYSRLVRESLSLGRVRGRLLPLHADVRDVSAVSGAVRGRRQDQDLGRGLRCRLVILFNVAYGVMNSRKTRVLAARVMGASKLRVLFDVMLLESSPQTFVGLRNGVSVALVIVVVAEMFIGSTGRSRPSAVRRGKSSTCRPCMRRSSRRARWLRPQPDVPADRAPLRSLVRQVALRVRRRVDAEDRVRACLADLVKRSVSPVDVLDAHLAVIERVNPKLNAIVTLAADAARAAARAAAGGRDARRSARPAARAADRHQGRDPDGWHSHHVRLAALPGQCPGGGRRGGAPPQGGEIVLAKTNTPEFATGANTVNELFGATRNPWNSELSPAGSSGGSAVAVATGMLPLAQGTDFGCSIRIPAAFCGIVGIRPTPGLTPNSPDAARLGPGSGPRAARPHRRRCGADARFHGGLQPPVADLAAPPWASARATVGAGVRREGAAGRLLSPTLRVSVSTIEIDAICRRAAEGLRDAGATVEPVTFDASDGRDPVSDLARRWMVGQQFARLAQIESFGDNLKDNVKQGMRVTALDLAAAEQQREQVFQRFRELFERYDLLLTPVAPVKPFPVEINFPSEINGRKLESYIDWIAPTFLITLVSLPAGSVPAGLTRDRLPVGLQVVAPRFEEPRILSVMKLVQRANPIGWPPQG